MPPHAWCYCLPMRGATASPCMVLLPPPAWHSWCAPHPPACCYCFPCLLLLPPLLGATAPPAWCYCPPCLALLPPLPGAPPLPGFCGARRAPMPPHLTAGLTYAPIHTQAGLYPRPLPGPGSSRPAPQEPAAPVSPRLMDPGPDLDSTGQDSLLAFRNQLFRHVRCGCGLLSHVASTFLHQQQVCAPQVGWLVGWLVDFPPPGGGLLSPGWLVSCRGLWYRHVYIISVGVVGCGGATS